MRSSTLTFSLINRQAGVLWLASCLRPGWETQRSAELTSSNSMRQTASAALR
jgi:hypothetical protein